MQVKKTHQRDAIIAAALQRFAADGVKATTMADIAADAGTSVGNLYRYFATKDALLAAAIPASVVVDHDRLLDQRILALTGLGGADAATAAGDLLAFWTEHRLRVATLLDGAADTVYADYPARFVERLVTHARRAVGPTTPVHELVLQTVFDNTRVALARLLVACTDTTVLTTAVAGFWSYQLPGLDGLSTWIRATAPDPTLGAATPRPARRRRR